MTNGITLRDFNTGKKVTCENTGKKFGGKVVYKDSKGNYYERLAPNGRKLGAKYCFRMWNDSEWVEQNWK